MRAISMFPASLALLLLTVAMPITFIFDGPIVYGAVAAIVALSVAIVALRLPPGEITFLSSIIRPIALVSLVPALWMVIQIVPLKGFGLNNPIWDSAATALGRPLAGSISIDPGTTLMSLGRYLSLVGLAFVIAAAAIDRHRAEWILFALTAGASLTAIVLLTGRVSGSTFFVGSMGGQARDAAVETAALGINFAAAAALHAYERGKTHKHRKGRAGTAARSKLAIWASLLAIVICTFAVLANSPGQYWFAIACGIAVLVVTGAMRRLGVGFWEFCAIVSVISVIAVAGIAFKSGSGPGELTLAFAGHVSPSLVAITQRILTDASWTGTGAGTFFSIFPVYKDIYDLAIGPAAPTAAAAIAVEMGRPFLWGIVVVSVALVFALLRAALRRGRDSFYSTAGASCVVTATLLAFSNAALFSTPVAIIVASALGLAVAQTKSHSI